MTDLDVSPSHRNDKKLAVVVLVITVTVANGFPRKYPIDNFLVGRLQGGLAPTCLAILGVRIVRACPGKVLGAHGLAEGPAADDVWLFVLVHVVPQVVYVLLDGAACEKVLEVL